MNIGVVVPGFNASESDPCIPALLSLVRSLAEEHSVRVFALRYPAVRRSYSVFASEVRAFGGAGSRGLARLPLFVRAISSIRRQHRSEPFDVLHAFWADEPGYVATRAARGLGFPAIVTLLGGELVDLPEIDYGGQRSRLNRILASSALARASRVTAGSTYLAELASLANRHRTPRLLPIGVDLERFRPGEEVSGLLAGGTKLLHVASLVPVKDQRTLLRAFARVRAAVPDASLNVVGEGPLERELRGLARDLGVSERVVFHGPRPQQELPSYYRSCDLFVMSSLHEGQEWVTQEAAACGCTTVGTRVGVVPDLEPATIAVPPGDAETLGAAIVEALSDRSRLRARGALAREMVAARYSLSETRTALLSLYRESMRELRKEAA